MKSSSSTAAYLMNASNWDEGAEQCFTPYSETTWLHSTLLRVGFTKNELDNPPTDAMAEILSRAFRREDSILGSDIGNTSKSLPARSLLDWPNEYDFGCKSRDFETNGHLQTFSLITNCNALIALLHEGRVACCSERIEKISRFLCECWWDSDNNINDNRNICSLYPYMLLAQALTDLLVHLNERPLELMFDEELKAKVVVTLFQLCTRPLIEQSLNGSWSNSIEQSTYATLILVETRRVPIFSEIRSRIEIAIKSAVLFMSDHEGGATAEERLRTEQLSYNPTHIVQAYKLAALKASTTSIGSNSISDIRTAAHPFLKLIQKTPLFSGVAEWKLSCSYIEATYFLPLLRARRSLIFSRTNVTEDKYFDIIPFTWTACNNSRGTYASNTLLFEMMIISFLNYQIDEYMEAVAGPIIMKELSSEINHFIDYLFTGSSSLENIPSYLAPLANFTSYIRKGVTNSSVLDQRNLNRELKSFLRAHIVQAEDNAQLTARIGDTGFSKADTTFFSWVRSTSADHTSCPYSFAFLSCLISRSIGQGAECFSTTAQRYYASDTCRHLATMCRMYNDYGSIQRDAEEKNLNSVDFEDFASSADKKQTLFELAEYERVCLQNALGRLEQEAERTVSEELGKEQRERRKMAILRMFCDVTDLYGQLYVVKDMASRIKPSTNGEHHAS